MTGIHPRPLRASELWRIGRALRAQFRRDAAHSRKWIDSYAMPPERFPPLNRGGSGSAGTTDA